MESPEQVFQQLCSEEYEGFVGEMIEGLLLLHPFNRVFSESLILISEEDENVSISICIPEDLKEYLDIRNHLFPALLASKAMLLKLWKTAGSEELYEAYLKSVEKVKVKDVTVEMPMTRGSIKRLKSLEAWRRTESLKNRQKDSG
jgi:hypothetical protein